MPPAMPQRPASHAHLPSEGAPGRLIVSPPVRTIPSLAEVPKPPAYDRADSILSGQSSVVSGHHAHSRSLGTRSASSLPVTRTSRS